MIPILVVFLIGWGIYRLVRGIGRDTQKIRDERRPTDRGPDWW